MVLRSRHSQALWWLSTTKGPQGQASICGVPWPVFCPVNFGSVFSQQGKVILLFGLSGVCFPKRLLFYSWIKIPFDIYQPKKHCGLLFWFGLFLSLPQVTKCLEIICEDERSVGRTQFCNDNSSLLYLGDCLPGSTGCPQGPVFYLPANKPLPPSHAGDAMSCSAGYSPLLATVDFHSDVRSDLALPDLFVTSARLSQVRLCTRTTFCGASDWLSSVE